MEDLETEPKRRIALRKKADHAKLFRSSSMICVLENPNQLLNIGSVMRNIDALGICKLYLVTDKKMDVKTNKSLHQSSVSASKWIYTRCFPTTQACLEHLKKNNFVSVATSPHQKGRTNVKLTEHDFTQYKKIAIWFGNESCGISDQVLDASKACVQMQMSGIVESLNLSVSTGIVLHHIWHQRYKI